MLFGSHQVPEPKYNKKKYTSGTYIVYRDRTRYVSKTGEIAQTGIYQNETITASIISLWKNMIPQQLKRKRAAKYTVCNV